MKNIIVSAADNRYSHLAVELYQSLKPSLDNYDFAILDCGLDEDFQRYFIEKNVQILKPAWEFELHPFKTRGRNHLKNIFSRLYLEKYFPGYENYIWMDSDTWINCPETFSYYIEGSQKTGFAITPQVDRSYKKLINIEWLFWKIPKKINTINFKNISKSISLNLGKKYSGYLTLNGGCFSYNIKFDGLKNIRSNLKLASKKGRIFGSDQVAFILSHYHDGIDFELLPAYCNWLCDLSIPKFSIKKSKFVEPYIPNHNIGVMHLAGMVDDRKKDLTCRKIKIIEDSTSISKPIRFEAN